MQTINTANKANQDHVKSQEANYFPANGRKTILDACKIKKSTNWY